MTEFEIIIKATGEHELIYGTSYARACEKWNINPNDVILIYSIYCD